MFAPVRPLAEAAEPPQLSILERRKAERDRQDQCIELAAERFRIFSERFATPIRPQQQRWFAGWRAVANAVNRNDVDDVVRSLVELCPVWKEIRRIASDWLSHARGWVIRAKAVHHGYGSVVPMECLGVFETWPSPDRELLPRWFMDRDEFYFWGRAIDNTEALATLSERLQTIHRFGDRIPDLCLDVFALIDADSTENQFRELFSLSRGVGLLSRMTAVIASSIVPVPTEWEYQESEIPSTNEQRDAASYLLNLVGAVFGMCVPASRYRNALLSLPDDSPMNAESPPPAVPLPPALPHSALVDTTGKGFDLDPVTTPADDLDELQALAAKLDEEHPGEAGSLTLTDRHELILREMLTAGVVGRSNKMTQAEIVPRCQRGANPDSWKRYFTELKKAGFTDSTVGPNGGVWLTSKGRSFAETLK